MTAPSKAAIVGCGQRGLKYALYALDHPELFQVVAICDLNVSRQEIFLKLFPQTLDISHVYDDWKKLAVNIDLVNELDIVVICTMDKMHKDPCVTFSNLKVKGILLEKPMAVNLNDCNEITKVCVQNDTIFSVCHVLRYSPHNKLIKELILNGAIGQVMNISHTEPMGYIHFAHACQG